VLLGASFPTSILAVGAVLVVATGRRTPRDWATMLALVAVTLLLWFAGKAAIRGRRRTLLFLRRFGFGPATAVVSTAVGTHLGQRWRAVTLDDLRAEPVGVRTGVLRFFGWGALVSFGALVLGAAFAVLFFATDGAILRSAIGDYEPPKGANLGAAILGAFGHALVMSVLVVLAIVVVLAVVVALTAYLWRGRFVVRAAERAKSRVIESEAVAARVLRSVERMSRRIFAPRMTVLRVADDAWRGVVSSAAGSAAAVLVDVSEPGENLLWEIATILPAARGRALFVGRDDLVRRVRDAPEGPAARLRTALDGTTVLTYVPGEERVFAEALRGRLLALARRDRRGSPHNRPSWRSRSGSSTASGRTPTSPSGTTAP
jgi:hypothetical protein